MNPFTVMETVPESKVRPLCCSEPLIVTVPVPDGPLVGMDCSLPATEAVPVPPLPEAPPIWLGAGFVSVIVLPSASKV